MIRQILGDLREMSMQLLIPSKWDRQWIEVFASGYASKAKFLLRKLPMQVQIAIHLMRQSRRQWGYCFLVDVEKLP